MYWRLPHQNTRLLELIAFDEMEDRPASISHDGQRESR